MPNKIKLLFAAVILWQPLQYMIAAKFGEPYPALIMPAFAGTMTDGDGNIRLRNVRCKILFQGDEVAWLPAHELLSPANGHDAAIVSHMFGPSSATANPWPSGSLKARLFPGRALSRARSAQKELDPQTKDWLERRLNNLYPSRRPETITFIWYEDVFNVNQISPSATEDVIGVREIRFQ